MVEPKITPEIDEEFKNFIPPLSKREYEQLEENILRDGCKSPISVIKGTNTIIDGYNRFDICTKHVLHYDVVEIELADRDEAKIWMITNQFGQRELTPYARAELALSIAYVFHKKGLENKSIAGKIGARMKKDLSNLTKPEELVNKSEEEKVEIERINTRKILAEFAEVSDGTMAKAMLIKEKATEEHKQKLRTDKTVRIDAVYKVIKEMEREANPKIEENVEPQQPEQQKNEHGVYSIIPEPVKASFVKVQEENLYEFNGDLHCIIMIGQKEHDCLITPVTGEENNFFFKLPNIRYLIVDYSSIFESMLPIVVDSTAEQEYLTCFRTFPDDEWNTFVELLYPKLIRKKPEVLQEIIDKTGSESISSLDTKEKVEDQSEIQPTQKIVTEQSTITDEKASKLEIETTTENPNKAKVAKTEKTVSEIKTDKEAQKSKTDEPRKEKKTIKRYKVAPQIKAIIDESKERLGLESFEDTIDLEIQSKLLDRELKYEPEKCEEKDRVWMRFSPESWMAIQGMKETQGIKTVDEVLYRKLKSKIYVEEYFDFHQ